MASFLFDKIKILFIISIIVLILCEVYLRLPFISQRLEYQVDEDIGAMLRPGQIGFQFMGNMSYKSPPVTLNQDGHRGKETDWAKPAILTSGNSDAIGCGVGDNEVWTVFLEKEIHTISGLENIQVVNAAHPGFGPYGHFIRLKKVLANKFVNAVIVRVDMADRYFSAPAKDSLPRLVAGAEKRQKIREITKGIPYLKNKVEAQIPSIKNCFDKPDILKKKKTKEFHSADEARKMLKENQIWWKKIADLTTEKDIPLIFMIYDIRGTKGSKVLEQGLKDMIAPMGNCYVLRLAPAAFGITEKNTEKEKNEIIAGLNLERDPHANAIQHKLIADKVFAFLQENKILTPVLK